MKNKMIEKIERNAELEDYITKRPLYNPHIKIYDIGEKDVISINSETFGRNAENALIIRPITNEYVTNLCTITAAITKITFFSQRRPQILERVLAEYPLGYLTQEDIARFFPKVYEYFNFGKLE